MCDIFREGLIESRVSRPIDVFEESPVLVELVLLERWELPFSFFDLQEELMSNGDGGIQLRDVCEMPKHIVKLHGVSIFRSGQNASGDKFLPYFVRDSTVNLEVPKPNQEGRVVYNLVLVCNSFDPLLILIDDVHHLLRLPDRCMPQYLSV